MSIKNTFAPFSVVLVLWFSQGLPKTVSHRLWLNGPSEFIKDDAGATIGLKLSTRKGTRKITF